MARRASVKGDQGGVGDEPHGWLAPFPCVLTWLASPVEASPLGGPSAGRSFAGSLAGCRHQLRPCPPRLTNDYIGVGRRWRRGQAKPRHAHAAACSSASLCGLDARQDSCPLWVPPLLVPLAVVLWVALELSEMVWPAACPENCPSLAATVLPVSPRPLLHVSPARLGPIKAGAADSCQTHVRAMASCFFLSFVPSWPPSTSPMAQVGYAYDGGSSGLHPGFAGMPSPAGSGTERGIQVIPLAICHSMQAIRNGKLYMTTARQRKAVNTQDEERKVAMMVSMLACVWIRGV